MPEKITVLGAGSWGIAVANLLHANGHRVTLWEFNPEDCRMLQKNRTHQSKLPGIVIPNEIEINNDLPKSIEASEYFIMALPAQKIRQVGIALDPLLKSPRYFINLAKGVEIGSLLRMSEVIKETINIANDKNVATLSGPSHAEEVSRNIPTTVVAGSINPDFAAQVQKIFNNKSFRVYRSTDLIGVELGGALKNVVAIASGITQGLGFGDNTTGALITRGLAEITRMGAKLGADPLTFAGLSGIGDLITTCISRHSRNRYVGEHIGRGEKLNNILNNMVMVAEGVDTCRSAYAMSIKYEVEMPITAEVYRVLFEDKPAGEALADLMGRSVKEEIWN